MNNSRKIRVTLISAIVIVVVFWILHFHNDMISSHLPKWNWVQKSVAIFGEKQEAAPEDDEDPDNSKNEIPVHAAHVTVSTMHRYVEGFGVVVPRPARGKELAGSANIVASTPSVISTILCQPGSTVHVGDKLVQLDDRVATTAVAEAQAALEQANASFAALSPRPDQLQMAQLAVDKATQTQATAQKNFDRVKRLAADQITAQKNVEQASSDLAAATNDLTVAQRQFAILKASPNDVDRRQEQAKVAAAQAALQAATVQKQMLTLTAPIDGVVSSVSANPGDAVDSSKTLVQIVAPDRLMVDADLASGSLPSNGDQLTAEILPSDAKTSSEGSGADQQTITGRVSFVSPQVDPKTGALQVNIDLPPDGSLRAGTSVRVRVIVETHEKVFTVPEEAVATDENGDAVIAVISGDQATHKHVKTGIQENGLIEVQTDGLKEGDTVATAGAYGLPQATRVKVID